MRGEAETAHGFLDAPLVVEVRDACPLVRRSHGCVDVVFDAGLARQRRKTLALRLFPLDARLPAFCTPKTPHAPANARRSVASSSRSPLTTSMPWRTNAAARSLSGLRVRPRKGNPVPFSARATAPP